MSIPRPNDAPVSPRVRYQVLRRDNFACRYCGRPAPVVALEVDHVVPRALGGTNDPSNLVTACADCNRGKAATSPGELLIEDVAQRELEWAMGRRAALEAEMAAAEERREAAYQLLQEFHDAMYAGYTLTEVPADVAGRPGIYLPLDAPVWLFCNEDREALPLLQAGVTPAHFRWLTDVAVRRGERNLWAYVIRWARIEAARIAEGRPDDSVAAAWASGTTGGAA